MNAQELFDAAAVANRAATAVHAELTKQYTQALEQVAEVWADGSDPGRAAEAVGTALALEFRRIASSTSQCATTEYMLHGLTLLTNDWGELPARLGRQDALLKSCRHNLDLAESSLDTLTRALSTCLIDARHNLELWEGEHQQLIAEGQTRSKV